MSVPQHRWIDLLYLSPLPAVLLLYCHICTDSEDAEPKQNSEAEASGVGVSPC